MRDRNLAVGARGAATNASPKEALLIVVGEEKSAAATKAARVSAGVDLALLAARVVDQRAR